MNEIPAAYVSGRRHIGYVLPDGNQCQRSCRRRPFHIGPGQAELWQRQYRTGDGFRDGGRGDDASTRGRIAGDQGQHHRDYRKSRGNRWFPEFQTSSVIVDTAIHFKRTDGSSAAAAPDEALYPAQPTAVSADERPMTIMTEAVTTGGISLRIHPVPQSLTRRGEEHVHEACRQDSEHHALNSVFFPAQSEAERYMQRKCTEIWAFSFLVMKR